MNFLNVTGWGIIVSFFVAIAVIPWRLDGMEWKDCIKAGASLLLICATAHIVIHTAIKMVAA